MHVEPTVRGKRSPPTREAAMQRLFGEILLLDCEGRRGIAVKLEERRRCASLLPPSPSFPSPPPLPPHAARRR